MHFYSGHYTTSRYLCMHYYTVILSLGSSGYFMSNLKPHQFKYTLVVTAITYEEEEATLVGQFRVFSRNTDETNNTCSIHMVNTRSNTGNNAIISKSGCDNKVEFVTIGHPDFKKNVECSTNEFNETIPCKCNN